MELLGIELSFEEFDKLMCEQAKGKELKVENGKVVAFEKVPTKEEVLYDLRQKRKEECFSIINRGVLWYETLTEEQISELNVWYCEWLTLPNRYGTDAFEMPIKPSWIK